MAFHQLEPWGFAADNLFAGIGAAATVNVNLVKGKPVSPADFLLDTTTRFRPEPEPEVVDLDFISNRIDKFLFGGVNPL